MKTKDIRKSFVQYFADNKHQHLPSSSLIPHNDPTLLFTNAGMNQFKDYFTGKAHPQNPRAVTVQKCVRAGGKHNDLENVGLTARHHTFFEMLGNFSFGDYFKKEAIEFAWEYLTGILKMPVEKLYVTHHHSDQEAKNIWTKHIGLSPDRVFQRGDKDNFWEMGEFGPCGPCSEIFFDHGEKYTDKNAAKIFGDLLDDEQRYVEIWNLVFMQFEKTPSGTIDLPNPSVDTGSGLERVAAAMQGKYFNYDTDLFFPIIKSLQELSSKQYGETDKINTSMRVVADHIRASTMLITDGVIPSNEGRGYVLRRIIRRAIRHLKELEVKDISYYKLVPAVFESLGEFYPENVANRELAQKLLKIEEERFLETLDTGMKFLEEAIQQSVQNKTLAGDMAFKLYDTFGFPFDLTEVILNEKGLKIDEAGFHLCMEKQKKQSRKSWKGGAYQGDDSRLIQAKEKFGPTNFLGYDASSCQATLLDIVDFKEHKGLIFNQTPFYGESGGQVGDRGTIQDESGHIYQVEDTQKPVDDLFVHLSPSTTTLTIGKTYQLKIDVNHRELSKRNHSATHLLQAALREILGPHVKQSGSLVGPEKLRFDFTHPERVHVSELKLVQDRVNQIIQQAKPVKIEVLNKDQALKTGALANFGDKYGDQVRVVDMGNFSTEFCGGTHVKNVSEIELFEILSEGSLASGVRRIEAVTSTKAKERIEKRANLFNQLIALFKLPQLTQTDPLSCSQQIKELEMIFSSKDETQMMSKAQSLKQEFDLFNQQMAKLGGQIKDIRTLAQNDLPNTLKSLQEYLKKLKKTIIQLEDKKQACASEDLFGDGKTFGDQHIFHQVHLDSTGNLKKISDLYVSKFPKGIIVLYQDLADKRSVLIRTHKSNNFLNCAEILKLSLEKIGGRGGGRPDMAQGSGDTNVDWKPFFDHARKMILDQA